MLTLYNSLTRSIENFTPLTPPHVGVYTCGPTVYSFNHIGNFRTYMLGDLIVRTLQLTGFETTYIMNFTDVGHLTGDNSGNADLGEDRMESAATKEGKTVWEVSQFYIDAFLEDFENLNMQPPTQFVKATDLIPEQIELIERLEKKGFTYQTTDGIYYDTSKFPTYGQLSSLDQIKEGARVEINPEKKTPRDFALWKFSTPSEKRQMEWESPWGVGFPGWHIECSAMSMKYLGESFDIHTGGMDLKETHHPNEIAQSEAVTGKKFVNYWMHGAFLLVNGEKMSKSKGNVYRIYDLVKQGYDPLAVRYLYLQTHYRQEMNFTFPGLDAAQNALNHLRSDMLTLSPSEAVNEEYLQKFLDSLSDDLNTPQALSVVWEMMKSDIPAGEKLMTLFEMDKVLGFNLKEYFETVGKKLAEPIPQEVLDLVEERRLHRKAKQYVAADHIRNKIKKLGYDIVDDGKGTQVKKL